MIPNAERHPKRDGFPECDSVSRSCRVAQCAELEDIFTFSYVAADGRGVHASAFLLNAGGISATRACTSEFA
jgi:hypothetical protein